MLALQDSLKQPLAGFCAQEIAQMLLAGDAVDRSRLWDRLRGTGINRLPDRVLIVEPEEATETTPQLMEMVAARLMQAVEDVICESGELLVAKLPGRGICVFLGGGACLPGVEAAAFGQRLLRKVGIECGLRVRIGVGSRKTDWRALGESHREARAALVTSAAAVAVYCGHPAHDDAPPAPPEHPFRGRHNRLVECAMQVVGRRLDTDAASGHVTISDVARELGVSSGHLSRVFRKVTGTTFEWYATAGRVRQAQRLLLDPTVRVADVAARCGFCNPAYFARVFRRVTGQSPREFRFTAIH